MRHVNQRFSTNVTDEPEVLYQCDGISQRFSANVTGLARGSLPMRHVSQRFSTNVTCEPEVLYQCDR